MNNDFASSWAALAGDYAAQEFGVTGGATSGVSALYGAGERASAAESTVDWNLLARLGSNALPFLFGYGKTAAHAEAGSPPPQLVQVQAAPSVPGWFFPALTATLVGGLVVYALKPGSKRR